MISPDTEASPFHVIPLQGVPATAALLGDDLGLGMARLYGLTNGPLLSRLIVQGLHTNLQHPDVLLLGVFAGEQLAGMAMAIIRDRAAELSWLHIFRPFEGTDAERVLLAEIVRRLREDFKAPGIIAEYLPFHASDLEGAFLLLGFRKIERLIMTAQLPLDAGRDRPTEPLEAKHIESAAHCLIAAYREHPSRSLHPELHSQRDAIDYLHRVRSGEYGAVNAASLRVCCNEEGTVEALCIGSELLPELGFIVQIVTHPQRQGQGLATALLSEVCRGFHGAGLRRVALGVTYDNPARRLYERMGFQSARDFSSFYWWRNQE